MIASFTSAIDGFALVVRLPFRVDGVLMMKVSENQVLQPIRIVKSGLALSRLHSPRPHLWKGIAVSGNGLQPLRAEQENLPGGLATA